MEMPNQPASSKISKTEMRSLSSQFYQERKNDSPNCNSTLRSNLRTDAQTVTTTRLLSNRMALALSTS